MGVAEEAVSVVRSDSHNEHNHTTRQRSNIPVPFKYDIVVGDVVGEVVVEGGADTLVKYLDTSVRVE